jgi:predicted transcriptional regulator
MNAEWFRNQFRTKKLSQNRAADLLEMQRSGLSRLLSGERRMALLEAHKFSEMLNVPLSEVIRQAGIETRQDVLPVPVKGFVDRDCKITYFPQRVHQKALAPVDCSAGTFAVQRHDRKSSHDGWLYFVAPEELDPRSSLYNLCLCTLASGEQLLATVMRGYHAGLFNLADDRADNPLLSDVALVHVCKVVWIKPV